MDKFEDPKAIASYSLPHNVDDEVGHVLEAQHAGPEQHVELLVASELGLDKVEGEATGGHHWSAGVAEELGYAGHGCCGWEKGV